MIAPLSTAPLMNRSSGAEAEAATLAGKRGEDREVRDAFNQFVGETFYGQMLGAMRKTTGKAAYFDGGRAEEVFRGQLDQVLAEKMTKASADSFTGPMFDLFNLQRSL